MTNTDQQLALHSACDRLDIEPTDSFTIHDSGLYCIVVDCERDAKRLSKQIGGQYRRGYLQSHYEVFNHTWEVTTNE